MSTIRVTTATVLGTVTETAATVTNAVRTVSDGVSFINRFMDSALKDQSDRHKAHRREFRDNLRGELIEAKARRDVLRLEFVNESAANKQLYAAAEAYFPADMFDD
ncbi:hypothetical protein [Sphingobium yanoikuyae]|uniref:Uncharacterized protein n=1 Tax=Sphingobium yanoikuyae TaxID=13690 RepID=A0A9X7YC52_SPHYA|nr:hypothetical protein [Sphingobium yanoikuyae]QNG44843.1 hypothetical protein H3V42_23840 [Sphingobium yanoikuyae]